MKVGHILMIRKTWLAMVLVLALLAWVGTAAANTTLDGQLMQAAARGDVGLVKSLLDKGANVNGTSTCGRTALMEAAWGGHLELIKLLLEKGADKNATTKHGKTPLMTATEMRQTDVMKHLLKEGADSNAKEIDGWTAARTAAVWGDVNELKLLQAHGAEETLCMAAMLGDTKKVQQLLAAGADINSKEWDGRTALMEATREGNVGVAKLLLDHGADLNSTDTHGKTALMEAVTSRHPDMVKLLLNMGVNVNAKHKNQWTALTLAVSSGQADIVKPLLNKGADPNTGRNKFGRTALMEAIGSRQLDLVRLLLDKGADVNTRNGYGSAALMEAAATGQEAAVRLLLDKGADVNAEAGDRGKALDFVPQDKPEIRRLLEEHGAKRARGRTISFSRYDREEAKAGTFRPKISNQNIRLDSEETLIRPKKIGYIVYAVFHFLNNAETTTEWVGFPKRWSGASDFARLDAWIDGRKVDVSEALGPRSCVPADSNKIPWSGIRVTFPGHSVSTIRVSYEADYSFMGPTVAVGPTWYGDYESESSACHQEPIQKFTLTIDGAEIGGRRSFDVEEGPSGTGFREIGIENVVRYEIKDYKPVWCRFRFYLNITPGSRERTGYSEELFGWTIDGWPR